MNLAKHRNPILFNGYEYYLNFKIGKQIALTIWECLRIFPKTEKSGARLKERILIVDDEEMIPALLARRLAEEGYSCAIANNGIEALNFLSKNDYSLIISDIVMPRLDGFELLERIRAINPSAPVIMITGYAEIETAMEAIHLGAYDFVIKPVNLDLVVNTVKKALEKEA
jgi:DNA-binding NtrC family response regulator